MSAELREHIQSLISYYDYHKADRLVETHPGFVVEDLTELLKRLELELNNEQ
jgi:hypothetical protein